ncbi:MAG TPA: HAD-IA family hydrolase [Vicinamibacteria bacterium]|nr:HAD-IA family hydrolase [Vicinamibacteria bacterium]
MTAGPPPRLVVFDLDGTLVDSAADLAAAVNAMLARLAAGTPPLSEAQVRGFIGEGARLLVRRSLAHAGLPHRPEDALPVFLECYRARLLECTRPYPGVAETLDALARHTLAVLTNKPGDLSRAIVEGLGLGARFARVYGGGDLPRKPDPAGLVRIMVETGFEPASTVMVGDSAVDVLTGRAAGVLTVGVSYGFDPDGLRAQPPDVLLDDLRALPRVVEGLAGARSGS